MWWHTVTHRTGKWGGNWQMEWVASTLHTTSEHGVSSITTADAHTSAVSSRLNWRSRRFKWIRPFRRKTKSGFCLCAITFQTQSTSVCQHVSARLLTARIFVKFNIENVYENPLRKIQIWLKSDNNNGLFVHFNTSIFLTADNSAKGIDYCIPMATLNILILLKATYRSSIMWTYCCETMVTQTCQSVTFPPYTVHLVGLLHLCIWRHRSCGILPLPGFQPRTVQPVT
jgi:hypothetical protein